jgi:transmembrane sensor
MAPERARLTPEGGATGPLAPSLRSALTEERTQQMWQRIDHAPGRRPQAWLVLATAATVVALLAFGSRWLAQPTAGPLGLTSGSALSVLGAEERAEAPRFDDGSQITLQKGSRVEVLRNDARSFVTALRRGDVTFDVKPGGKRHWVIEAGELSVEVVGTRFRVERQPQATRVSVEHGIVLVRGERVGGGSVRLTAGQSFVLPTTREAVVEPTLSEPRPASPAPVASAPPAASVAPVASAPPVVAPDRVAQSLVDADDARRQGDNASAAQHFEAAWLSAAPGDARRGLAALSLARLLGATNPAKTARVLRSSLSDMPSGLREDAIARWVEAESRAGNVEGARRAAEEYRRSFPNGQRLPEVERWSAP